MVEKERTNILRTETIGFFVLEGEVTYKRTRGLNEKERTREREGGKKGER